MFYTAAAWDRDEFRSDMPSPDYRMRHDTMQDAEPQEPSRPRQKKANGRPRKFNSTAAAILNTPFGTGVLSSSSSLQSGLHPRPLRGLPYMTSEQKGEGRSRNTPKFAD